MGSASAELIENQEAIMGFRYAVIGAGRQGTAAAFDLARFGEAEYLLLADQSLEQAARWVCVVSDDSIRRLGRKE